MSTRLQKATRVKKLVPKAHLQIVRDDQVDDLLDLDNIRGLAEFGVDASEASVSDPSLADIPSLYQTLGTVVVRCH